MNIGGEKFTFVDTIETPIAVADSWVKPKNKLGGGNGEAKLYVATARNTLILRRNIAARK